MRLLLLIASVALASADAAAQDLPDITNRDYAIDLYQGSVFGSTEIVGMGGASVAVAEGTAGLLFTPAAIAVWPTTSADEWDWTFHFDALNRLPGEDLDNNGIPDPDASLELDPFVTLGLGGRIGVFSAGAAVTTSQAVLPTGDEIEGDIAAATDTIRVAVGASLFGETLSLGATIQIGQFIVKRLSDGAGMTEANLFQLTGGGLELGAVWKPAMRDFRVGAAVATPITGSRVELDSDECDPNDCAGYILPERVAAPYSISVGGSYRFGPTRWNQKFGTRWRDESYWLVAADLVITGPSEDAYGIGAFARRKLQRSGEDVSLSARVGAEYEWIPGRLRIRFGSYWEPSRYRDVSGRLHVTFGLDLRIYQFCFWDSRYRLQVGATGDAAEGYGNGGLSVGFWH